MQVRLIMPYISRIPPGFEFFLEGVKCNPEISICWLTDQHIDFELPGNIIVRPTTLEEIRLKAEKELGTPISLDRPYKLCDLKPAYGAIFPELIEGYDYWGWGDFDVVWGNLHSALEKKIRDSYDVITFHNFWLSGALTVVKNCETMNNAFKRHSGWKSILGSSKHFAFDECEHEWDAYLEAGDLSKVDIVPKSLSLIIYEMGQSGEIRCSFEHRIKEWLTETDLLLIDHENSTIKEVSTNVEYPLFHWVLRNRWPGFYLPKRRLGSRYHINRQGFWPGEQYKNPLHKWTRILSGNGKVLPRRISNRIRRSLSNIISRKSRRLL